MADKISSLGRPPVDLRPAGNRAAEQRNGGGAVPVADDAVDVSSAAVNLRRIEARLAELPDVDRARVAAVRERLEAGAFEVDPRRVAERLLGLDRELGRP